MLTFLYAGLFTTFRYLNTMVLLLLNTVFEQKKLDPNICSAASLSVFKKNLLKFITPSPNSVFSCHNCKGIKCLTRLRLSLRHLRELKFKHSFQDALKPFCSCGYCPLFTNQRCTLWRTVNIIDILLTNTNDSILTQILLFGKASLDIDMSANILKLNATMNYIISTNRFEESLFQYFVIFYYMFISLTLFRILMTFLRLYIHIHLVLRFSFIIY